MFRLIGAKNQWIFEGTVWCIGEVRDVYFEIV